jgi:hypothetical protein
LWGLDRNADLTADDEEDEVDRVPVARIPRDSLSSPADRHRDPLPAGEVRVGYRYPRAYPRADDLVALVDGADDVLRFRLPQDPATPIIMVGPGTGVAPFRAFLEEREAAGAKGRNWLFFGDRNFNTDFLYQREWLEHRKNGLLTRIDVAFSRDTAEKVYVQHRMRENRRELYAWLQEGAHFYVCGDAQRMAPDVHEALIEVVAQESGRGHEHAVEYVNELQAAKRYQRDIY